MSADESQALPLRFDSFSFDARCYNTLRCSILFANHQHALNKELNGPSGQPYSPDWKDDWDAGFVVMPERVFPAPAQIKWTALDGMERHASVDLATIFPDRRILHSVPSEDIWEEWASIYPHTPEVLLEVNDRTINVYMRVRLLTKHLKQIDDPDQRISRRDLVLAWTESY